ncbi:MAG: glycosyltransferase [Candidatus Eisenbacteria bacterium]|uniref:Glycosyltransferase n=1 Tax=Eiseniibacteriota bacterium TaxID=2212470 RepID=A0A538TEY7_UNCEI|nr:MAG: glycosyltransferase [Candidatus Eisenbacteria bacterium]
MEPVTVIATVRNEAASIGALLDSILSGTRLPDEIVVADGGSTDRTLELLRSRAAADPRIHAVSAPGNRSIGRNAAVRASRSPIIACTDGGVQVEPEWLERITQPFDADPGTDVVAGFYSPVGTTWFERAAGVISAPRVEEIDPARFLPSTRSIAFRRSACRWRPRGDVRSFFRQHRRFGFGDGESRVQGWFYATLAAKYVLGATLFLAGFPFRAAWWLLGLGVLLFAAGQARRGAGRVGILVSALVVPSLKVVYDVAYLSGYVRGRLKPRPPG